MPGRKMGHHVLHHQHAAVAQRQRRPVQVRLSAGSTPARGTPCLCPTGRAPPWYGGSRGFEPRRRLYALAGLHASAARQVVRRFRTAEVAGSSPAAGSGARRRTPCPGSPTGRRHRVQGAGSAGSNPVPGTQHDPGPVAHLVEHPSCTRKVVGSSPIGSTHGDVAPPSRRGPAGRGASLITRRAQVRTLPARPCLCSSVERASGYEPEGRRFDSCQGYARMPPSQWGGEPPVEEEPADVVTAPRSKRDELNSLGGSTPSSSALHGDASRLVPAAALKAVGVHARARSTRAVSATRR